MGPTATSTTSTRSLASIGSATTSASTPWTSAPAWASPWRAACSSGATERARSACSPGSRAATRTRAARRRLRRDGQAARRRARAGGQGSELRRLRPARSQGHRHDLRHQPARRRPHLRQRPAQPREPVPTTRGPPSGQAQISEFLQCYFAAIDSLGMCLFATLPALDMPELQGEFVKAAAAITGRELPEDYLIEMGDQIVPHGARLQPSRRVHREGRPSAGLHRRGGRPALGQPVRRAVRPTWTRCSRAEHRPRRWGQAASEGGILIQRSADRLSERTRMTKPRVEPRDKART